MKKLRIVLGFGLAIIIVFVTSCLPPTEEEMAQSEIEVSHLPTDNIVTPSPTYFLVVSPTIAYSPTTNPTLPVEIAKEKLLYLLSDNADCTLPCIWGIKPGESTYKDAQNILIPFTSISEFSGFMPTGGSVSPVIYFENSLKLALDVGFLSNSDQIVTHIVFNTYALSEDGQQYMFDSKTFGEWIEYYSVPHVLSEQGIPESVMIATSGGPLTRGGFGGFDILLLYPEQGILVNYTTQMYLIGDNVRGCPQNAHVEMELYPPGNSTSFFQLLEKTNWAVKMNYYMPLEDVTTLSTEDFYQVFHDLTDKCIETPANLWPIPEP